MATSRNSKSSSSRKSNPRSPVATAISTSFKPKSPRRSSRSSRPSARLQENAQAEQSLNQQRRRTLASSRSQANAVPVAPSSDLEARYLARRSTGAPLARNTPTLAKIRTGQAANTRTTRRALSSVGNIQSQVEFPLNLPSNNEPATSASTEMEIDSAPSADPSVELGDPDMMSVSSDEDVSVKSAGLDEDAESDSGSSFQDFPMEDDVSISITSEPAHEGLVLEEPDQEVQYLGTRNRTLGAVRAIAAHYQLKTRLLIRRACSLARADGATSRPFADPSEIVLIASRAWARARKELPEYDTGEEVPFYDLIKKVFPQYRGWLKDKAREKVETTFHLNSSSINNLEAYKSAVTNDAYVCSKDGVKYQNPVLFDVLKAVWFKHARSEGITRREFFEPIPMELIALVFTAVRCALDEYATGQFLQMDFNAQMYSPVYDFHLGNLKEIEATHPGQMEQYGRYIWEECTARLLGTHKISQVSITQGEVNAFADAVGGLIASRRERFFVGLGH